MKNDKTIVGLCMLFLCALWVFAGPQVGSKNNKAFIAQAPDEIVSFYGAAGNTQASALTAAATTASTLKTNFTYTITVQQQIITNLGPGLTTNIYTVATNAVLVTATTNIYSSFTANSQSDAIVTLANGINAALTNLGIIASQ